MYFYDILPLTNMWPTCIAALELCCGQARALPFNLPHWQNTF